MPDSFTVADKSNAEHSGAATTTLLRNAFLIADDTTSGTFLVTPAGRSARTS